VPQNCGEYIWGPMLCSLTKWVVLLACRSTYVRQDFWPLALTRFSMQADVVKVEVVAVRHNKLAHRDVDSLCVTELM
jgi:hypothetical protein